MVEPAQLFNMALLITGVLYVSMVCYFNGLLGLNRLGSKIAWNSELVAWILLGVLAIAVMFRLTDSTALSIGAGTWFLIGSGNLLVVYVYLIIKFARHTLPNNGFWGIVGLVVIAVLYSFGGALTAVGTSTITPTVYGELLQALLLLLTLILFLALLFNLLQSLWVTFIQGRSIEPQSTDRHTAIVNMEGQSMLLNPGDSSIADFGERIIEDHGYKADVRILASKSGQSTLVEVSNDLHQWEACFLDDNIDTDWDVPYLNSPWRYVRVTNSSDEVVELNSIVDLD